MIIPSCINSILEKLTQRWPLLVYATTWTTILTATVAVTSFAPELAFVWAITPSSSFSKVCQDQKEGFVRVPFDVPSEIFCLPAEMFKKSKIDLVVPPIFAAVIVAASACLVRALGLWEVDEGDAQ
ncbi:unnamed protein product [Lactuca virosa]|uniref:Uncharacterized protein n=1 Tax=Lactuca virosa TaxID=75947 RepID=A0AAU9PQR8_9ASTR|nr:unnamed protein product [Lactuca virosa]